MPDPCWKPEVKEPIDVHHAGQVPKTESKVQKGGRDPKRPSERCPAHITSDFCQKLKVFLINHSYSVEKHQHWLKINETAVLHWYFGKFPVTCLIYPKFKNGMTLGKYIKENTLRQHLSTFQ